jgi:hypothetical protein
VGHEKSRKNKILLVSHVVVGRNRHGCKLDGLAG